MLWFIVTEGKNRGAEEFVYLTTAIHSFYSTDSSTRCIAETVSLLLFVCFHKCYCSNCLVWTICYFR